MSYSKKQRKVVRMGGIKPAQHGALRQLDNPVHLTYAKPRGRGSKKSQSWLNFSESLPIRIMRSWGPKVVVPIVLAIVGLVSLTIWLTIGHNAMAALVQRPTIIPTMQPHALTQVIEPNDRGVRELIPGSGTQKIADEFVVFAYFDTLPLVLPAPTSQVVWHEPSSPWSLPLVPFGFDIGTAEGKAAAQAQAEAIQQQAEVESAANNANANGNTEANSSNDANDTNQNDKNGSNDTNANNAQTNTDGTNQNGASVQPADPTKHGTLIGGKPIKPLYLLQASAIPARPVTGAATLRVLSGSTIVTPISGRVNRVRLNSKGLNDVFISSFARPDLQLVIRNIADVKTKEFASVVAGETTIGVAGQGAPDANGVSSNFVHVIVELRPYGRY